MAQKLKIKTTIKGIVEVGGEETAVNISVTTEVTNGDYLKAVSEGIAQSIGRAILTCTASLERTAQDMAQQ